jgi:hypothetical protein
MNPLNAHLAFEIMNDSLARADRHRLARTARERPSRPRYESVTIRRTTPDDWAALDRLAQLEGRDAPIGDALVAEVDEHILAARWIDDSVTLSDPFVRTAELVALLEARARHLEAQPRLITHPLRRAARALHRAQSHS